MEKEGATLLQILQRRPPLIFLLRSKKRNSHGHELQQFQILSLTTLCNLHIIVNLYILPNMSLSTTLPNLHILSVQPNLRIALLLFDQQRSLL